MIYDIVKFFKYPVPTKFEISFIKKFFNIFLIYIISKIIISFFDYMLSLLIESGTIGKIENTSITYIISNSNDPNDNWIFLIPLIFVPIIEESTFRLSIQKFNHNLIRISISLLIGLNIYNLVNDFLFYPFINFLYIKLTINYIYIILFSALVFFILKIKWFFDYFFKFLLNYWEKKFKFVFYCSVFMFALYHIYVIKIESMSILLYPFVLLPFCIPGFFLGYVRVRYGFLFSVFLHILYLLPNFYNL